ncbi:hypothetical protein FGKAn22_06340 [Ferrigenium kumadai]|uniref:HTH cro/C1-type domain-containing protein n=1 Tax=Ferrigenium kumadai TaxID=1682490 RepID=A0AAN1SYF6_9PROT|nr:helix-turn-helix transcriptional regulator [Ferrigenium kumadai]BBI98941.1 hypothetical protein FGKAn22_06340 [Ferrigenium kumadai]
MNPFSIYFHDLRRRYRISQRELANLIGYEQGYISGLEIGRKGPPNEEFVSKLIMGLNLDAEEQAALRQVVQESQRKYVLPSDASADVFRMVYELWGEMESLHPAQIRMIRDVLHLRNDLSAPNRAESGRTLQKGKIQGAKM